MEVKRERTQIRKFTVLSSAQKKILGMITDPSFPKDYIINKWMVQSRNPVRKNTDTVQSQGEDSGKSNVLSLSLSFF